MKSAATETIMMTSTSDSGTGPTPHGPMTERTWKESRAVRRRLAPGAFQTFGDTRVPTVTLLLCTGALSVGAGSVDTITDPIVHVRPGGSVTLRAHTSAVVIAVSVPAADEAVGLDDLEGLDSTSWRLIEPSAYVDGLRALVATLLDDDTAGSPTDDALVERILGQAVAGVAVRY